MLRKKSNGARLVVLVATSLALLQLFGSNDLLNLSGGGGGLLIMHSRAQETSMPMDHQHHHHHGGSDGDGSASEMGKKSGDEMNHEDHGSHKGHEVSGHENHGGGVHEGAGSHDGHHHGHGHGDHMMPMYFNTMKEITFLVPGWDSKNEAGYVVGWFATLFLAILVEGLLFTRSYLARWF